MVNSTQKYWILKYQKVVVEVDSIHLYREPDNRNRIIELKLKGTR